MKDAYKELGMTNFGDFMVGNPDFSLAARAANSRMGIDDLMNQFKRGGLMAEYGMNDLRHRSAMSEINSRNAKPMDYFSSALSVARTVQAYIKKKEQDEEDERLKKLMKGVK